MFVSSLLGDSMILVASIKYKAFNLQKMIVTFIQHIEVNDLLNAVGSVAPSAISAIFNSGSPSRSIDYVGTFMACYTTASSSVLISALRLGKLLLGPPSLAQVSFKAEVLIQETYSKAMCRDLGILLSRSRVTFWC